MKPICTLALLLVALTGCKQDYDFDTLVGHDGILRFNLVFDNETNVDLDLHVTPPNAETIYWAEKTDTTGGELDVDCFCSDCPQGPNENVFWGYDTTPEIGDYEIDVNYFGPCDFTDIQDSNYTLRFLRAGETLETHEGTLGELETDTFTFSYTEWEG